MDFKADYEWKNTHENVVFKVSRLYNPWNRMPDDSMPADKISAWRCGYTNLQSILKDAEHDGKCVRALGGGWSLSEAQKTTDYFIGTKALNLIFAGLDAGSVTAGNDPTHLVLAQCGAGVQELNQKLLTKNLALPTSGASDGQTIAGAISTGTHGGALLFGSMQDYAVGIHLITASDKHFWIEGNSQIVTDHFLSLMPGIQRINDDEVFNAVIVSFGSFGIIHGILLQVEDAYMLEIQQDYLHWDLARQTMDGPGNYQLVGLPDNPHHFEITMNPFLLDEVIKRAMYKIAPVEVPPPQIPLVQYGPGADVLTVFGKIAGVVPAVVTGVMHALQGEVKKNYPKYESYKDYPGNIFSGGQYTPEGKALSTEIGVDAANAAAVMDIVLDEIQKAKAPLLIGSRYVKKSKATLAFTKFDITCTIELPGAFSNNTQKCYDSLWARLDSSNIDFTLHWGQCNNLDAVSVRKRYGNAAVDSWIKARAKLLPTAQQQSMFSNDFLVKCGLSVAPVNLIV